MRDWYNRATTIFERGPKVQKWACTLCVFLAQNFRIRKLQLVPSQSGYVVVTLKRGQKKREGKKYDINHFGLLVSCKNLKYVYIGKSQFLTLTNHQSCFYTFKGSEVWFQSRKKIITQGFSCFCFIMKYQKKVKSSVMGTKVFGGAKWDFASIFPVHFISIVGNFHMFSIELLSIGIQNIFVKSAPSTCLG